MTEPPRNAKPIYAIGDIHGCADLLHKAVRLIDDHAGGGAKRVVCLGDYIDRGPRSRDVIEILMRFERDEGWTCLMGNHEDLMVRALTDGDDRDLALWLDNGGDATLASYGLTPATAKADPPHEHLQWMASRPLSFREGHRLFVHAGAAAILPPEKQPRETLLWVREAFLRRPAGAGPHVVHGHTPMWAGKPRAEAPELLPHRTNLDTGAYATGVLTVGVFASGGVAGPSEILQARL
ncbi:MAG: serine/threonine protein phosphatase [Caulobacteraceae bacterium]|nr:serine/threonine protein phosphatase [Caulobacteraceae bacterium]